MSMESSSGSVVKIPPDLLEIYYYLKRSLEVLSHDAEEQCEELDYCNVSWEIRDDFRKNAEAALKYGGEIFSPEQRSHIEALWRGVTEIPDSVVNVAKNRTEHLLAMKHQCWVPLRESARKLLKDFDDMEKSIKLT